MIEWELVFQCGYGRRACRLSYCTFPGSSGSGDALQYSDSKDSDSKYRDLNTANVQYSGG